MNIPINTDDLIIELRKRLRDKCVCSAKGLLPEIEKMYLDLKEQADKDIPLSCIE